MSNQDRKTLETYSEIEAYLGRSIELLNGIEMTEEAKILQQIQQKYQDLITDWMRKQNLLKLRFSHHRSIGVEYILFEGEKDEK